MANSSESPQSVRVARASAVLTAAVGLLGLAGYALEVRYLAGRVAGVPAMAPSRAVMLVLGGISLWLVAPGPIDSSPQHRRWRRVLGRLIGVLLALYGGVLLGGSLASVETGVDRVLFPELAAAWRAPVGPDELSPLPGLLFAAVGLTLVMLDSRARRGFRPAVVLGVSGALLSVVAFLGNIFGLTDQSGHTGLTGMAPQASVAFLVLSVGVLACRPERAGVRQFISPGLGGVMLRRLAPAVLLVIALLAAFLAAVGTTPPLLRGLRVTVAMTALLVLLYVVLLYTGAALDRADLRAEAERQGLADHRDHLFAMSHDLMWVTTTEGLIECVNPAWQRTLGYPPADLPGRPLADFVHPDDVDQLTASGIARETRFRHRDGTYRWINWSDTQAPVDDAVYAVGRDVTVHRATDESRARLAAIVENTEEAIIGKTPDGIITSWNSAAERIYGYRAEEVVGRSVRVLIPPGRHSGDYDGLVNAARGGPVKAHDSVRLRKDGTEIHVDLSISPVRDDTGKVIAEASISREITSRWRADERFRRLVVNAPVAMVMVDAGGVISLVNQETERLFGYPADDLVGRDVEILVPYELRAGHTEQRRAFLTAPVVRTMGAGQDLFGQRRDGTQFPVEIRLAPLDIGGDQLVSAVIHDITERKQIQVALATARDNAVAAANLRSQFVATVSHEIRTPMNGVIGLTNLLLDTGLSSAQRRYVDGIQTSSRALLAIINDILDFSKIEAGKVELAEVDFDLCELVEEVVNVAAEASRGADLEVVGHCAAGLPTAVRGDEGRIRQVLLNLAGNAVKFTERGEVVVRIDAAETGESGYTFTVTDSGIGIDPAHVARLFEPFIQLDNATSRQYGGTGLGLTISRQLVELMHGELHVVSEVGHGTQFSFTIPLTAQAAPQRTEHGPLRDRRIHLVDDDTTDRESLAVQTDGALDELNTPVVPPLGLVLLAEDNDINQIVALDTLAALGYTADLARNGIEAVELADVKPYQVILMDCQMPRMDGFEATRHLRDREAGGRHIPIIALTAGALVEDRQRCLAAGMDDYLAKPLDPEDLRAALERWTATAS